MRRSTAVVRRLLAALALAAVPFVPAACGGESSIEDGGGVVEEGGEGEGGEGEGGEGEGGEEGED